MLALLLGLGLLFPTSARAEKWALLIGIDQYKHRNRITPLGAAAQDARNEPRYSAVVWLVAFCGQGYLFPQGRPSAAVDTHCGEG